MAVFFIFFNINILQAGTIQILGNSEVSDSPDAVSFTITVHSQCYPSINEAREANDQISTELFSSLNQLFPQKDKNNQISTHGGYTKPYNISYRPRDSDNPCKDTFQKITHLTVKTSHLDNFENLFNQVQDLAYQKSQPQKKISSAVSFTTMNQPNPQLSTEKYQALEKQAIALALENAKEKAEYLIKDQNIPALKMISINESFPNFSPTPMPHMAKSMMIAESSHAPIQFQDSVISKQLSVVFEY